jgi:phosphonate transport system substrate-binding protein
MMRSLLLTTCQAVNTFDVSRAIAGYIGKRMQLPVRFIDEIPWKERYRLIGEGRIHVGWICGLPYVRLADQPEPFIELLAAPVMIGERYGNRPVYFSDVIVHSKSKFMTFADLRGVSWAYNEKGSQSGYNVTCYHLAMLRERSGYFGRTVGTGAHRASLKMVLDGQIDASAIDSTVLEWEIQHHPEIRSQLRVVATLGPSPIPPWVILRNVPTKIRQRMRHLFLEMHHDRQGRDILAMGYLDRFTTIGNRDYDIVRHMAQKADQVGLE